MTKLTEYDQFTSRAFGFDFDGLLPPLYATGEMRSGLLTRMTQDLLAKRITQQIEQKHPTFQGMTDDMSATYVSLMIAKGTEVFLRGYFELKDMNPNLRISECGELLAADLNRFQELLSFKEGTIDMTALRRTLPSLLEESYKEAKSTIETIRAERAAIRAKE